MTMYSMAGKRAARRVGGRRCTRQWRVTQGIMWMKSLWVVLAKLEYGWRIRRGEGRGACWHGCSEARGRGLTK